MESLSVALSSLTRDMIGWANSNQGFITLLTFLLALLFGWVTGIFKKLMFRPKLHVDTLPGPTQYCTFSTGEEYNGHQVRITAISVYLKISNRGNAPSSITKIHLGIRRSSSINPFSMIWLQQTNAMDSFTYGLDDKVKIYPLLFQVDGLTSRMSNDYLLPGQMTTGVVYFEQDHTRDGRRPRTDQKESCEDTKVKIVIKDAYGHKHKSWHKMPIVDLESARKYNREFGNTLEKLRAERAKQ